MTQQGEIHCITRIIPGSLPGDFDTTINPGGSFPGSNGNGNPIATGDLGFPNLGDDLSNGGLGGGVGGGSGGPGGPGGAGLTDNTIDTGLDDNVNCDYLGTCYDGKEGSKIENEMIN